jgi:hypothetical protein
MKYSCGTEVMLGDEIMASYGPKQESLARVVAIGLDLAVENIDRQFYGWAKEEKIISDESVIIEWKDENPMAHNDPNYSPVGNYMTLSSLCCETFIRRSSDEHGT